MEVHPRVNSVLAKRLWNVLRVTFFMIRKGFISKRKLIMDINLMMKRGKLLRKSVTNLLHHHHHNNHRQSARDSYGLQEYEFSCSNSPNPVFFNVSNSKRKHHYFPCINMPDVVEFEEEEDVEVENNKAALVMLPKHSPDNSNNTFNFYSDQFASGEKRSPIRSPFSVRVSNFSSEEENNDGLVDDEAEEFIRRFYEQLRLQSRMQLLQYQDIN